MLNVLSVMSALKGLNIDAADGRLGMVVDYLFDDRSWRVKWLVIECGGWVRPHKVFLHPSIVTRHKFDEVCFDIGMKLSEVAASPYLVDHQPVSRQIENEISRYSGSDRGLDGVDLGGAPGDMTSPLSPPPYMGLSLSETVEIEGPMVELAEAHLQSVVEIVGYRALATDGRVGKVSDLIIDSASWRLHDLIVETSPWWFGKRILVSPGAVTSIDWSDREVSLNVTQAQVKARPSFDPPGAFEPTEAADLKRHHGWPGSAV